MRQAEIRTNRNSMLSSLLAAAMLQFAPIADARPPTDLRDPVAVKPGPKCTVQPPSASATPEQNREALITWLWREYAVTLNILPDVKQGADLLGLVSRDHCHADRERIVSARCPSQPAMVARATALAAAELKRDSLSPDELLFPSPKDDPYTFWSIVRAVEEEFHVVLPRGGFRATTAREMGTAVWQSRGCGPGPVVAVARSSWLVDEDYASKMRFIPKSIPKRAAGTCPLRRDVYAIVAHNYRVPVDYVTDRLVLDWDELGDTMSVESDIERRYRIPGLPRTQTVGALLHTLSDDDGCTPSRRKLKGMRCANIPARVYKVVAEQLGQSQDIINADTKIGRPRPDEHSLIPKLDGDLGIDELDYVELVMAIEDEFYIEFSSDMAAKLYTPGVIAAHVEQLMKCRGK